METAEIRVELARLGNAAQAANLQRFFQTGPGEYGAGDRFRGIRVPVLRKLARQYTHLPLTGVVELLRSEFHEDRLLALFILINHYYQGDDAVRAITHASYLEHIRFVNNWDLVDASAPHLVGDYLKERDKALLTRLAVSPVLWERRIAILATFAFIKVGNFDESLSLARILLGDPEDLLHKAVGWMLREVGKRQITVLEAFLREHYRDMPRTMLRYTIERFPPAERRAYLKGTVG
jgi:3-methyladenine DNA glycosylase AlkD